MQNTIDIVDLVTNLVIWRKSSILPCIGTALISSAADAFAKIEARSPILEVS